MLISHAEKLYILVLDVIKVYGYTTMFFCHFYKGKQLLSLSRYFSGRQSPLTKEIYHKNSKIWDASNNCHNCPKNSKV